MTPYDIPPGCVAGYYPECNPQAPVRHHAERAEVPAVKSDQHPQGDAVLQAAE